MSVRIYQLARQLNLDNKSVIELLKQRGLEIKSPSSTIPNIYAEEFIRDYQKNATVKAAPSVAPIAPAIKASAPKVAPVIKKESGKDVAEKQAAAPKANVCPKIPLKAGTFVRSASEVAAEKQRIAKTKKATVTPPVEPIKMPLPPKPVLMAPKIMVAPKIGGLPKINVVHDHNEGSDESGENKVIAKKQITIKPPVVVREFSTLLNIKPFRLISELMEMGIFASMNQTIDEATAQKIANKYNIELVLKHRTTKPVNSQEEQKPEKKIIDESQFLETRPPIVCVLGHVDHGKTTLIDFIRKAHVANQEAGGITQHVGAYQVVQDGKKITFLDTPGHAAFSKIRQRGATVTDIAILVVAADDGFMPQTDEALKFAQKENVPVVVAINKIDAKGANIDRVKQQMQKRGITSEDWGGETLCVGISALKGTNIPQLLEAVLVQAEIMDLKANPKCPAEGVVIESKIEMGRGATTTVIINKGTLRVGDALICGKFYCKVRALLDENGVKMKEATPATPVQILGWSGAPDAGANFSVVKNEKEAKRQAEENERELRKKSNNEDKENKIKNIQDLMAAIESNKQKTLKVIVRADVQGSVEAVVDCLNAIQSSKVNLEVIDANVGQISLNDIHLAHAAGATLVGFNTRLENGVQAAAKHDQVNILQHNIIYEIIDQVKDSMRNLLDSEWEENKLGSAEVRQIFPLAKSFVAGCMVVAGKILREASVRLIRHNKVIAETKIQMLKRFKDDVTEVKSGYECGIQLSDVDDYIVGDIIECYEMVARKPDL